AYVLQACDAIAEAHDAGIVHRDLKPANLFVTFRRDGAPLVKVLDFGVSKLNDTVEAEITKSGATFGSPSYMSPEQMSSARDVDGRTDIWSLGVLLFELMTGERPFAGASMPAVCLAVVSKPPRKLRDLLPDAPEALEAIVSRCLEKDREKRF